MSKALEAFAANSRGKSVAFPYWLRKYPTKQDMLDCPYSIPRETFHAYPPLLQRSFSRQNEHAEETVKVANRPYFLKYRHHVLDTGSRALQVVAQVGKIKSIENHLSKLRDKPLEREVMKRNNVMMNQLQTLRVTNFPDYWRLMQDFNMWKMMRPRHQGFVDLGVLQSPGPESKFKTQHIEDYIDPETLYGCEETGESRFAVAKRTGKVWEVGMQVYLKDRMDGLWKIGEVLALDTDARTATIELLAMNDVIENHPWEDMKPFDLYATARTMPRDDPVRAEEAESLSRAVYFDNLKQTDPARFEQEWYQHICSKYYDGNAPTGSFRGWRQRFMHWDPKTTSSKRIRWVMGLSKYMQRRVYLGYPVRQECFEGNGSRTNQEPWWTQIEGSTSKTKETKIVTPVVEKVKQAKKKR